MPPHYDDPDDDGVMLLEPPDPPAPAPWGWRDFIVNLAEAAEEALYAWAFWHIDRAEARGITDNPGRNNMPLDWLAEVAVAAGALSRAIADDRPDAELDAISDELHNAISEAKFDAEHAQAGYALNSPQRRWCEHQAIEVETSLLRGWARNFDSIAHCFCMARQDPAEGFRWAAEAAYTVALGGLPNGPSNV